MKKTLILALTAVFIVSLVGCGASGNNENTSSVSENSSSASSIASTSESSEETSKEASNEASEESSISSAPTSTVSEDKTQLTFNGFVKEVSDGSMTVEIIAEEEETSQETTIVVVYNDSISESVVSSNMVVTVKYTGSFSKDGETLTVQADSWEAL